MSARPRQAGRTTDAGWTAVTVGLLAAHNFLSNRVFPPSFYVPANLAMSMLLVLVGRGCGLTWHEMGWGRESLGRGVRWGLEAASSVAVAMVVLARRPEMRPLFRDGRVSPRPTVAVYEVLLRIPLGTALFEETAFRAVLPGLIRKRPTLVAALLFGLWHVLPTIDAFDSSPLLARGRNRLGSVGAVGVAVGVTTVAGYGFSWLRRRSDSLIASIIAHAATNSLSYLISHLLFPSEGSRGAAERRKM